MPGQMINAPAIGESGDTQFISLTEQHEVALFENSNDTCSEVFKVPNTGQGVLLTTFCLDQPVWIERVKVDIQEMPHGTQGCCSCNVEHSLQMTPPALTNSECVSQLTKGERGVWAMGYGVSMGVLSVPGSYRLCTRKPCNLAHVTVCAKLLSTAAMGNIPPQLIFGNTS